VLRAVRQRGVDVGRGQGQVGERGGGGQQLGEGVVRQERSQALALDPPAVALGVGQLDGQGRQRAGHAVPVGLHERLHGGN
jgi:hypothetical protein